VAPGSPTYLAIPQPLQHLHHRPGIRRRVFSAVNCPHLTIHRYRRTKISALRDLHDINPARNRIDRVTSSGIVL